VALIQILSEVVGRGTGLLVLVLPHSAAGSMAVRLKFRRERAKRKAAAAEPLSSIGCRAPNEMNRRREIIRRNSERAKCRHDADVDLVREALEITDELSCD